MIRRGGQVNGKGGLAAPKIKGEGYVEAHKKMAHSLGEVKVWTITAAPDLDKKNVKIGIID